MNTRMSVLARIAWDWGVRCFGLEHMQDWRIRGLCFGEEAIEVMQVLEVSREQAHRLVDVVYDRPIGKIEQEIGGSIVTLAVLCRSLGQAEVEDLFEREVQRVLSKTPEHFRIRNKEKIDLLSPALPAPARPR